MNVQAQAGFVYLSQGLFSQAAELFYESRVDVREVSAFFLLCLPFDVATFMQGALARPHTALRHAPSGTGSQAS